MKPTLRSAALATIPIAALAMGVAPALAGEANAKITAPSAGSTVTGESITVKGSYWATASVKEVRVSLCTLDAKGLCTAYLSEPANGTFVTNYRSLPATLSPATVFIFIQSKYATIACISGEATGNGLPSIERRKHPLIRSSSVTSLPARGA